MNEEKYFVLCDRCDGTGLDPYGHDDEPCTKCRGEGGVLVRLPEIPRKAEPRLDFRLGSVNGPAFLWLYSKRDLHKIEACVERLWFYAGWYPQNYMTAGRIDLFTWFPESLCIANVRTLKFEIGIEVRQ